MKGICTCGVDGKTHLRVATLHGVLALQADF